MGPAMLLLAGCGQAEEAVRVCLGGPIRRETLKGALEFMGHALEGSPEMAGTFF